MLIKCAGTAMNSKLIARNKGYFAPIVVSCVEKLDKSRDLSLVGIKKIPGGALQDSVMVEGVAFKKTFSYAGFEQMQKKYDNPKILLLNVELELKSEKENAEIRISDAAGYQEIVDAEWKIIYEKLDKCVESGAKVILSKLPIGDLGTQYFADKGLFCAGRVDDGDMTRTARATGAVVQTSVFGIDDTVLGSCDLFEERQIGDERYNVFTGCATAESATIILRGGSEQFIEESQRSIWDALMVVKRCMDSHEIVAGGGAIEMELSRHLKEHAKTIFGKSQLLIGAYAKAFEIIPRQLSDNAGLDSTDILNMLRKQHADITTDKANMWFGVDVSGSGGMCNTLDSGVWEPAANKKNSIAAATEAACLILSIDETVRNPKSEQAGAMKGKGKGMGGKGGAPVSRAMGGGGLMGMGQQMMSGAAGMGKGMGRGARVMRGRGGA